MPDVVFQKRMLRSAIPPPVARRLRCQGHHASAFTAEQCSVRTCFGVFVMPSQTATVLSLLPDAKCDPSGDHSNRRLPARGG